MDAQVQWGILSTAKIGRTKMIPGIQAASNGHVAAIAGRDTARTRAVAEQLGIARFHGSYERLLEDPAVDAVYIPLPNHLHAEWTIRAAEAGKHVLCEKPMALSATDAERMVEACEAAGVVFMEAFMYRLHPSWEAVVEMVRDGRIGRLTTVQSWFSYYNDDATNIRNIAAYGGGALMDIGCYSVNLSRLLFGSEPLRVDASSTVDPVTDVDVVTSGILDFDGGSATFTCATQCEPDQRVHIYGTQGRIEIEIPFNIPADRPTSITITTGRRGPIEPQTETLSFDPADQYRIEAERFAQAVLGQADTPIPPMDGIANMRVIDRLMAAAKP
jgi:predicted dehydrogenase